VRVQMGQGGWAPAVPCVCVCVRWGGGGGGGGGWGWGGDDLRQSQLQPALRRAGHDHLPPHAHADCVGFEGLGVWVWELKGLRFGMLGHICVLCVRACACLCVCMCVCCVCV